MGGWDCRRRSGPVAQGKSKALIRSRSLVQVQSGLLGGYCEY